MGSTPGNSEMAGLGLGLRRLFSPLMTELMSHGHSPRTAMEEKYENSSENFPRGAVADPVLERCGEACKADRTVCLGTIS